MRNAARLHSFHGTMRFSGPWKAVELLMRLVTALASAVFCALLPVIFDSPASTIFSADETAAIALAMGPGSYSLGPESLMVSGGDTLQVLVVRSRRLTPPRNPRVACYTPTADGAMFLILPEDPL